MMPRSEEEDVVMVVTMRINRGEWESVIGREQVVEEEGRGIVSNVVARGATISGSGSLFSG